MFWEMSHRPYITLLGPCLAWAGQLYESDLEGKKPEVLFTFSLNEIIHELVNYEKIQVRSDFV